MAAKPVKQEFAICSLCGHKIPPDEKSMNKHLIEFHPAALALQKLIVNFDAQDFLENAVAKFFELLGRKLGVQNDNARQTTKRG